MSIVDELKEIGAMVGINPTGNNILEVVKSMKSQLIEKKVAEKKAEPKIEAKEVKTETKPEPKKQTRSRKQDKKLDAEEAIQSVKFTKE